MACSYINDREEVTRFVQTTLTLATKRGRKWEKGSEFSGENEICNIAQRQYVVLSIETTRQLQRIEIETDSKKNKEELSELEQRWFQR